MERVLRRSDSCRTATVFIHFREEMYRHWGICAKAAAFSVGKNSSARVVTGERARRACS